jgi:hypothetical protein
MATIAWTTATVPGSVAATGNPVDSATVQSGNGRCPRCERGHGEIPCTGVYGTIVHLGG